MERCFVKFPAGVAYLDASPALDADRARLQPYFSRSDERVLIANLAPEEQAAALTNGAKIYYDFLFHPAFTRSPFEFAPRMKFWELSDTVQPAGPEPWQGKSVQDVLERMNVPNAWRLTRGAGTTVIVVDSGVDDKAAEFPQARRSPLSFGPDGGGWNDPLGHGSMVASLAAGSKQAGGKYDGVAPEATILSARTTYSASDLYGIYDRLLTLKKSGQLSGPLVVNNSYQVTRCSPDDRLPKDHPYAEIVEEVIKAGIVMVFAAGNNHADMMCWNDPAAATPNTIWAVNSLDEVISVGAINWDDSNTVGAHANSSRGPGEWARVYFKPDCVAPCYGEVLWGHAYRVMEWWGTSGAAPLVSGVVALMLARANNKGRLMTTVEVADAIRQTCQHISGAATCVGHGRVDAAAAVGAM
jgi:serine protease AprX